MLYFNSCRFLFFFDIKISSIRIEFLDYLIQHKVINLFFATFCILIVINGSNFMDGVNTLVAGYFMLILLSLLFIFSYLRKFFYRLLPLLTIIFLYTFAYTLTIVSMRYRFPIEPILIIFASYSAKEILLKKIK